MPNEDGPVTDSQVNDEFTKRASVEGTDCWSQCVFDDEISAG
jgi:hypothetical protein